MGRHSIELSGAGAGSPLPLSDVFMVLKKKKKKKWKEAEAGVVWKWELHTGSEVEAMRTRWYGSGSEEGIVERTGRRRVYTIGASLVACGE